MIRVKYRRRKTKKVDTRIKRRHTKVKVGFPFSETDDDIINRAVWNHFGTSGSLYGGPIPERPFLANAIRDNKSKYKAAMKKSAKKILRGEESLDTFLNKLGIFAQGHIQTEIKELITPPNSPVTIEAKGSSNPLIDTGEMVKSVTWMTYD